jgi:hypothetical protein
MKDEPNIDFFTRWNGTRMVSVSIGGSMVAMELGEWLDFCHGVVKKIETHLLTGEHDGAVKCDSYGCDNPAVVRYCKECAEAPRRFLLKGGE